MRATELEEQTVCAYAETSLRLACHGAVPKVSPAPGRPAGMLGELVVRLVWPKSAEPPLEVRVIVHDELDRAAWREASAIIGDAVRAALLARRPADSKPKREGPNENHD